MNSGENINKFQNLVWCWAVKCFGEEIAKDITERSHRFFEEATELVQSTGMSKTECYQLVDYVFSRPIGDVHQEIGGTMVTLGILCASLEKDMGVEAYRELDRILGKIEAIRFKQSQKPKFSPLPIHTETIEQFRVDYYENKIETYVKISEAKDKEIAELREQLIRTEKCLSVFQKAEQNKLSVEEVEGVQIESSLPDFQFTPTPPPFPADRRTIEMDTV